MSPSLFLPRLSDPTNLTSISLILNRIILQGGGWALGSIDTHDSFARNLALGSGCTVISVGVSCFKPTQRNSI